MNEERRRRLVGQYAAMAAPPDRLRAVKHYQDLARQAELNRLEAERERIIGALVTAQQRIDELKTEAAKEQK